MVDILTGEELKEYEEELQYSIELYGADVISPPYSTVQKLVASLGAPRLLELNITNIFKIVK